LKGLPWWSSWLAGAVLLHWQSVRSRAGQTKPDWPASRIDPLQDVTTVEVPIRHLSPERNVRCLKGAGNLRGRGASVAVVLSWAKFQEPTDFQAELPNYYNREGSENFTKKKFCTPLSPDSYIVSGGDACQDILGLKRKTSKPSAFTPFARWRRCCPQALWWTLECGLRSSVTPAWDHLSTKCPRTLFWRSRPRPFKKVITVATMTGLFCRSSREHCLAIKLFCIVSVSCATLHGSSSNTTFHRTRRYLLNRAWLASILHRGWRCFQRS